MLDGLSEAWIQFISRTDLWKQFLYRRSSADKLRLHFSENPCEVQLYCMHKRCRRQDYRGKKQKSRTVRRLSCECWHYLSSRAVSSQVFSAKLSLTSVFGMGTGGPSVQSTPTIQGLHPENWTKMSDEEGFIACIIVGQALGLLVPVSCIHYCTSTSGLSTR